MLTANDLKTMAKIVCPNCQEPMLPLKWNRNVYLCPDERCSWLAGPNIEVYDYMIGVIERDKIANEED